MKFIDLIKKRAKANPKKIVFPETKDIRVIEAAEQIINEKIAEVILIGNKNEINRNFSQFNIDGATFINPATYEKTKELTKDFFELRKHKGMTEDEARRLILENPLYFGVMLVNNNIADGMVAGAANSTGDVLRASLQILKTAPGTKLISTFFIMDIPNCEYGHDGTFLFSDCGLNQNPDEEQLAYIAISSGESFKNLVNAEPYIAMLSYSSKGSSVHADVDKVINATKIARKLAPDLKLDGEFQLDAAIVPSVAELKTPDSDIAGKANVLIFPDLDAGNIGYKLVERLAKANAYGPILQGIKKPINDLSRGCSAKDIIGVTAITVVQAQNNIK